MYDESFLNKISSFGVLGYSVEKIIFLVDPENPEALKRDIETPGTDVYKAYWKGKPLVNTRWIKCFLIKGLKTGIQMRTRE